MAEVRKAPKDVQEMIAALILEEIEDDRRWEEAFARSPGTLTVLAARAAEQVRVGQIRRLPPLISED
jgi:hypothetical protein